MMHQFNLVIFIVLYMLGAMYITTQVIGGINLSGLLKLGGLLSPVLLMLFLSWRRYWIGILLGLMTIHYTFPIIFLDRIPVEVMFLGAMLVLTIGEMAIVRVRAAPPFRGAARLLMLAGVIIWARVLWDRPGSARMGMSGGLWQASLFALSPLAFWVTNRHASGEWPLRKNLIVATIMTGLWYAWAIGSLTVREGLSRALVMGFGTAAWWLSSAFLVFCFARAARPGASGGIRLLARATPALVLTLSLFAGFRSRPVFALGIIAMVATIYRQLGRTFMILIVAGVIGLGGMLSLFPAGIPQRIMRTMSLVVSINQRYATDQYYSKELGMSGEMGWRSTIRGELWTYGVEKIKEHPWIGRGFAFDVQDFISVSGFRGIGVSSDAMRLGSGSYHNSLMSLAVACGLPAVLLFSFGFVRLVIRFVRRTLQDHANPDRQGTATVLLGYLAAATGQMLMNGDGNDILHLCMVLGILHGLYAPPPETTGDARPEDAG